MSDEFDAAVAKTLDQVPAPQPQSAEPTQADFDAAVAGSLNPSQVQAARAGFALAYPTDPDAYAEAQSVAGRANLPVETVLANPKQARQQVALGSIDFDTLGKTSPVTAALLADVERAKVAHDDVDNLTGLERLIGKAKDVGQYLTGVGSPSNTLAGDVGAGVFGASRGAAGVLQAGTDLLAAPLEPLVGRLLPENPLRPLSAAFGNMGAGADYWSKRLSPPQRGNFAAGVSSAVQSIVQNTSTLPLALVNPALPLFIMGGIQGGQSYQQAREQGLSLGQALPFGVSQAAIEYATEKLPLHLLLKDVAGRSGFMKSVLRQVAAEIPQEQLAQHLQDLNEWAVLPKNSSKTVADYLAERPDAAVQTLVATIVGAGANTAVMHGSYHILTTAAERERNAQAAQTQADFLKRLTDTAAASKLAQRAPDTFEQFVAQAAEDGPVPQVFIDANTLMQSGVAEDVAQVSPSVAAQLPTAARTGGQIAIPTEEYAARIAPTEAAASLLDHLKTDPEGFSRAEAQEYLQTQREEMQADFEQAAREAQNEDSFKQSADTVRESILTQLNDAKRFTPQVNDAYATMVGQFYATQAARLGITPEAMFDRYPLRVVAEGVGGQRFDQGAITTPEFKNWFGDSKVVDGSGAPLVVYHGTLSDFSEFQNHKGIYFTTPDPDFAARFTTEESGDYAQGAQILPVYVAASNPFDYENKKHVDAVAIRAGLTRSAVNEVKKGKWQRLEDRTVLEAIKNAGFDGVYVNEDGVKNLAVFSPEQIKSATGNRGTFDPNDANILNQGARGFFSPGTNTIGLLKTADLSTFLHESGHFFLEVQMDLAAKLMHESAGFTLSEGEQQIVADAQALLSWFGVSDFATWYNLDFEEKRTYHEQFARGFEAYLFEGKAPSIELQGLFQKFRAWMLNVYRKLSALNVQLSDEVRGVFDRMLATNDQILLAEQGRSMLPLFETPEQAGMSPEAFAAYQALGNDATQDAVQDLQARGLRDMQWLRNARARVLKDLQKKAARRRAEMRIEARREVMSQPVYQAWQFLTTRMTDDDKIKPVTTSKSKRLDPSTDSLFVAIAKLGGLDRDEVKSQWGIDSKEVGRGEVFGSPILRAKGGRSIDDMRQALIEAGYLDPNESSPNWNPREFEDRFDAELRGDTQYSFAHDPGADSANLKAGEQLANPQALTAGRLDLGEMSIEGYPAEVVDALKARRMTAAHGLHPDIVAELFGFTSGDELVRALAAAQPPQEAIDAATDVRMLERYGDLATPEALSRAADAAIHNDARARFTATEANALQRLANPTAPTGRVDIRGRPLSRGILLPAARELARNVIARVRVRDLRPGQYTAAEARAARNAAAALKQGNVQQAAAEKRNQVIQQQLARQALAAQDEVERTVRYLKKFDREGVRKSLDPDFRDQIDALLDRFDLRTGQSLRAIDKRTSLAAWIDAQAKTGVEPDIAPYLVAEANRTSYKNLTIEELRGLSDAVRQIEHLGRLKHRLLTDKSNREFAVVRDEVVALIQENGGKPISQNRQLNREVHGALSRGGRYARELWAAHMNIAEWVRRMSGNQDGGALWEYLVRTANERAQFESDMKAQATEALAKILDPVVKLQKMGGAGQFFPSINRSLNAEERFAIALNMGNEGNIQRVLGGENWTPEQIKPVLESLTSTEWRAVQSVWDFINDTYRPLIGAKQRRVYGVEPDWVQPQALTVNTADGNTITLRGGYYPIKYDSARSTAAQLHNEAEQIKQQMGGGFTSATTSRSFTKGRADEVKGRPILYSLSGLYSGVNEVIHDLAWHEFLIDANRLVKDRKFGDVVRQYHGAEVVKEFTTWTRDIATGDRQAHGVMDTSIAHLRQMLSASRMGFSVWTALLQPLGLTQTVVRIGGHWTGEGIKTYLAHPIEATRIAQEKSPFMAARNRTKFRELNQLRALVERRGQVREFLARYPYWLMLKGVEMAEVPTWHGAYLKAQSEGHDEAASIALADQAVIDSQSSGELHNRARIQRGGELQQLMTPFMTFMRTNQALARNILHGADTPAKRGKAAAELMMIYLVPSVVTYLFHKALMPQGGDDDDTWTGVARGLIAETISYMMGGIIGLNQIGTLPYVFETGRPTDYAGPAALAVFGDAMHVGGRVVKAARGDEAEFNDSFARALINLAGDTTGIPSSQINRTLRGVQALREGRINSPAEVARSIVFGAPSR